MDFQQKGDIVENKDYIIYLKKKIGSGNQGSVYDCERKTQNSQNESLCAKIVLIDNQNKLQVEREDEIMQILQKENNENLIKIYFIRYQYNDKKLIIIMEKCKCSLQDEISKQKKFSNDELQDFLQQLFKGYHSLWKNNIIHRDLKPDNILIKENFGKIVYKITDFGAGKKYYQNNCLITNAGTPAYCAPECNMYVSDESLKQSLEKMQRENKIINYQSQADIFSIGLITYQLVFNDFPIKDAVSAIKFFDDLKEKKFAPNFQKRISTNLPVDLIFQAIVYLPENRITFKYIFDKYLKNNNISSIFQKNQNFIPPNQMPQNQQFQQNQNQNNQFQAPNQQQFGQALKNPNQISPQQPLFQPLFQQQLPNQSQPFQQPPNFQQPITQNQPFQQPLNQPSPFQQSPNQSQPLQQPQNQNLPFQQPPNQQSPFQNQNQNSPAKIPSQQQQQNQNQNSPFSPLIQLPVQNQTPQFLAQNQNPQFLPQNQKLPDNTPQNQNQNQQFKLQVPNSGIQFQAQNQSQQIFANLSQQQFQNQNQFSGNQNNIFNNQQQGSDQKEQTQDQQQWRNQNNFPQNISIDFSQDSTTYLSQELNQNKFFFSSEVQAYFKKLIKQFQDKSFKDLKKTLTKLLTKFEFDQESNYSLNYLKFYFVLVYSKLNNNVKWDRQTFENENELKQKIIEMQHQL